MAVHTAGCLANKDVQHTLAQAHAEPEKWEVYLVRTGNTGRRTLAQNKLFRRLLSRMAQQLGYSVQYWHDLLVVRFLGMDEVLTQDGYVRKVLPSTAELNVVEFTGFLNACLAFAADNHVELS